MKPHPHLEPGAVHVWQVSLSEHALRLPHLRQGLSGGELSRAQRLRLPELGKRFMVGRGVLREILAGYLGGKPEDVRFSEGPSGKPALAGSGDMLRFNGAHSGDLLLVAVTLEHEVGVDVELIRHDIAYHAMARRYFSPAEQDQLFDLPPDRQLAAFYRCWTRKEAYLKGTGDGFSQPCTCFEVSLAPGEPAAILNHHQLPEEAGKWRLHDLAASDGYCAALAVAGEFAEVTYLACAPSPP